MQIRKRNGKLEDFNAEKINRVIAWACEDISDVSDSDVAMNSNLSIVNKMETSDIQEVIIQSAANLITEENPNYQYVASRLQTYGLRKQVWGESEPPRLYDHIRKNKKNYDPVILESYSESEIHKINKFIKHDRDYLFTHAGISQMMDKYLMCDRTTGEIFETPQFVFILVPMILFRNYENRLDMIKTMYNYLSTFKINLPTPILAGVRTSLKYYSSCVLVDCGDSLESIFTTAQIIGTYTARRSGIGINMGRIRAIGSPIRKSEVISTGIIPFLKIMESSVKATSQNGLRGGGATVSFPWWHYEAEDILVLKNNRGTDDNRVRKLDYCFQIEQVFIDRVVNNQSITLFCPNETKGLYEAFGTPAFKELYEKYEQDKSIKLKKVIKARELMGLAAKERLETGRIYIMFMDNANSGPWLGKVNMTNLCVAPETLLLTDNGHIPILDLVDSETNIWNGQEWSKVIPKKTGENQKLVTVVLSDGKSLDCTLYHKWKTVKNYSDQRRCKITEKRTHELNIGDKLCKFNLPIIDGDNDIKYAYTHGLFCADGTHESSVSRRISLYGEKKDLAKYLDIKTDRGEDNNGRHNIVVPQDMAVKFYVPLEGSVKNKLEWLAGYLDGDGTIARNGTNESIQVCSVEHNFLKEIQLLLQTLGVDSKICDGAEAGDRLLPDGLGGYKLYSCKETKRLLISSNGLYSLIQLGFKTNRLKFNLRKPQREASHFVTVVDIQDNNRISDTYCVSEPINNTAIFNGILTGNCVEILQPTSPLISVNDTQNEIGVCILSALNLLEIKEDEYEDVCRMIVYSLNELIDYQLYPFEGARKFCQNKRSLGVGITNFAAYLASKKLNHESTESIKVMNDLMEKIQYHLLSASCEMAEKFGPAPDFGCVNYATGQLPCDRIVHEDLSFPLTMDWEHLRARIKKFGLKNDTMSAQMPCESSSVVQSSTNAGEPVRSLLTKKIAKNGVKKVLIPRYPKNKNEYSLAFDIKSNDNMIKIAGAQQRWIDMGISFNTYLNYNHYPDGKIPISVVIKDILTAHKYGLRTMYYNNTPDDSNEGVINKEGSCEGGACFL